MRDRALRAAASNYVGKIASLVAWFVLTPFILHRLGPVGYGLWVLVGAFASYGYLLDFGIGGAIVKYVAEHVARGDTPKANRLLATTLHLYLYFGVAALGVSLLLAPVFPRIFQLPIEQHQTAMYLVVLMGATIGLTLAFSPAVAALQGVQRYDLYNIVSGGGSLLTAAGTYVALLFGGGVLAMVAVTIPSTLLMRVVAVCMLRRVAPELHFGLRGADRSLLREVMGFSASAFVIQLSSLLNTKSDEFIIAILLPVGAVTPYALARRLGELAQLITEQLLKALIPMASELDARNEETRLRRLYLVGSRATLAVLTPLALTLALFAGPILNAWVGPPYDSYAPIVVILVAAGYIGTSQWTAGALLQGMARHRKVAQAMLVAGGANVLLSLVLVGPLGLAGVALATLLATTAASLGAILPYAMRRFGVTARVALTNVWLPGLVPALPAAMVMLALRTWWEPQAILSLAAVALFGAIVYGSFFLTMEAAREERALAKRLLSRVPSLRTTRSSPESPDVG